MHICQVNAWRPRGLRCTDPLAPICLNHLVQPPRSSNAGTCMHGLHGLQDCCLDLQDGRFWNHAAILKILPQIGLVSLVAWIM